MINRQSPRSQVGAKRNGEDSRARRILDRPTTPSRLCTHKAGPTPLAKALDRLDKVVKYKPFPKDSAIKKLAEKLVALGEEGLIKKHGNKEIALVDVEGSLEDCHLVSGLQGTKVSKRNKWATLQSAPLTHKPRGGNIQ